MRVNKSIISFILGHFKQKPGMYLGKNHISLLSTFIDGYKISLINNGFDISTDPFFGKENKGFFNWYLKKYGIDKTPSIYFTMLEQYDNSEEKALEHFINSLELFCKEEQIV